MQLIIHSFLLIIIQIMHHSDTTQSNSNTRTKQPCAPAIVRSYLKVAKVVIRYPKLQRVAEGWQKLLATGKHWQKNLRGVKR